MHFEYNASATPGLLSSIKRFFRKAVLNRLFNPRTGRTRLHILRSFPLFSPNSQGNYKDRAALAIQTINQTIPLMSTLAHALGSRKLELTPIDRFPSTAADMEAAIALKQLLDKFGSDKGGHHDYHYLYGPILADRAHVRAVLEIGMGTDNTDVVSNMGAEGKPGASLRAFREFLPAATIFGADIDRAILFSEERIQTFFVDQTDPATFEALGRSIPTQLDLVIDDGLHSPDANIRTLQFGLSRVKPGGWVVIEDISPHAIPLWETLSAIIPADYDCRLLRGGGGIAFAIQRPV